MYPLVDNVPKVMIIENNPLTADAEKGTAEDVGFTTHVIGDGTNAIEEIKKYRPNILILDLHLPGKTGVQIQEEMFQDPELRDIPTIPASVHVRRSEDPENLWNKYKVVYERYVGKMPVREVLSDATDDLILELTAASGDLYNKIPQVLMEYWKRVRPHDLPPYGIL